MECISHNAKNSYDNYNNNSYRRPMASLLQIMERKNKVKKISPRNVAVNNRFSAMYIQLVF